MCDVAFGANVVHVTLFPKKHKSGAKLSPHVAARDNKFPRVKIVVVLVPESSEAPRKSTSASSQIRQHLTILCMIM